MLTERGGTDGKRQRQETTLGGGVARQDDQEGGREDSVLTHLLEACCPFSSLVGWVFGFLFLSRCYYRSSYLRPLCISFGSRSFHLKQIETLVYCQPRLFAVKCVLFSPLESAYCICLLLVTTSTPHDEQHVKEISCIVADVRLIK